MKGRYRVNEINFDKILKKRSPSIEHLIAIFWRTRSHSGLFSPLRSRFQSNFLSEWVNIWARQKFYSWKAIENVWNIETARPFQLIREVTAEIGYTRTLAVNHLLSESRGQDAGSLLLVKASRIFSKCLLKIISLFFSISSLMIRQLFALTF